ncbi:Fc.00g041800.m01.CDS01 [Cosmosporella sp. VM-42]
MRYGLASPALRQCLKQQPRMRVALAASSLRKFATTTTRKPLEEEKCPNYDPKAFYPARIGDILGGKYELVSKLGWGSGSTVWLARVASWLPWQNERYFALKITNNTSAVQAAARREIKVSDHMFSIRTTHPGRDYVRSVLDSFEVEGPSGKHICLAFEPLRQPLWMMGKQNTHNARVQPRTIKAVLPSILKCLDFIHSECQVIHTDLKGDHLMVPFEDPQVLQDYVNRQEANPAPELESNGRPIYESRTDFGRMKRDVDFVKVTDFGLAVRGDVMKTANHDIQPKEYTAPEVMLKAGWTYSADIWNLGMVLWELLADVNILSGVAPGTSEFSDRTRFAQMIRLMGPPPQELLSRADPAAYAQFYNEKGEFKYPELIPGENFNFSSLTPMLAGEDKERFVQFAKKMLTWVPEERATAKQLLEDPWLQRRLATSPRTSGFGTLEDTLLL